MKLSILAGGVAALALSATAAGATTYIVHEVIGPGSVTGSITTDGATGPLVAADITAWNLNLNGVGATYNITNGNSVLDLVGADLTASASHLFFNFDGSDGGGMLFQQGLFSGQHYWCDNTTFFACFAHQASVTPQSISDPSFVHVDETGNQIIASIATGIPEPATWGLMVLGVGLMGGALRRRSVTAAA